MSTVAERVQAGIDWLNNNVEGWLNKIDVEKFDFIFNCALAQASGFAFPAALRKYSICSKRAFELGFMFSNERNDSGLEFEWKKRIKELKEANSAPQFDKWIKASDGTYYKYDCKDFWQKHNEFGEIEKYVSVFEIYSILSHGGTFIKEPVFKERVKYPLIFANDMGIQICFGDMDGLFIKTQNAYKGTGVEKTIVSINTMQSSWRRMTNSDRLEVLKIFERAVNEAKKNGEI